ncbi:hypothetical protein [Halodesulfurarchaeum formicicum]|uniref:hypothetical protein n=1 Tax=Halodesulfurarchaeum formicicum TaxID=1873524 RepID=UPI0008787461|nr:hypothetical protein [Halodesulfurarchaeum formicicum]
MSTTEGDQVMIRTLTERSHTSSFRLILPEHVHDVLDSSKVVVVIDDDEIRIHSPGDFIGNSE